MITEHSEPKWSEVPLEPLYKRSAYAMQNPSFSMLTGGILGLLQAKFSDPDQIYDPKLKNLIWQDDETETCIHIVTGGAAAASVSDAIPAIYVKRAPVTPHTGGILQDFNINSGDANNFNTTPNKRIMFQDGSHKIMCEGTSEAAAESLGEEVYRYLLEYAYKIKQDFHLYHFNVQQIPETISKKESNTKYITPIVVVWQSLYCWELIDEEN